MIMRKFVTYVIIIPLALVFVAFAVANRHFVTVSFDPFDTTTPAVAVQLPLFALIIAVAILGVIAGGMATWFGQRHWRRADMVGFVFFPPSPRHLALALARELGRRVEARATKVALTVDADDATLESVVDALKPDVLQLHGKESPARLAEVKRQFGCEVMKAIAVEASADLASLAGYAGVADRILFDAHPPKGATRPGGLGAVFDWHLLQDLDLQLPFLVSGGLTADNVAEAVRVTCPGGVDVSSGVERAPGVKDVKMIEDFIRAARAVEELAVR